MVAHVSLSSTHKASGGCMCPVKFTRKRNILADRAEGNLPGGQAGLERAAHRMEGRRPRGSAAAGV